MDELKINVTDTKGYVEPRDMEAFQHQTNRIISKLEEKSGDPDQFLGWLNLPQQTSREELAEIARTARSFTKDLDTVLIIGIGGSYLGAKAVIEALSPYFGSGKSRPEIVFAGQNIDEDYHHQLREWLNDREYGIVVISKSGTTTEPGIAFRIFKEHLEEKKGQEEASRRIIAVTDKTKGALRKLTNERGYKSYVIPDDVGGRYSVLTPVGLVPIAMAGYDLQKLLEGAEAMRQRTTSEVGYTNNPAAQYAVMRNALYQKGKAIEILGIYQARLYFFMEWWKQLFGESEGKDHKGIFPSIAQFTTDLHSMGQYIQEGRRILFETILSVEEPQHHLSVPSSDDDTDKLNYLSGKRMQEVNAMAEKGTRLAHTDGDVPNMTISIPRIDEYNLGQLIYFFEKACAISGYMLDVDPFNQPGVEAYKTNMFGLLGKPGYEKERQRLMEKLRENGE
jgi:glucose-6-phosphate isomerase